jgi:hypothetical protein
MQKKRKAFDRYTVMAMTVGCLVGMVARPVTVSTFWWSHSDARQDEWLFILSIALGGTLGLLAGMVAGIAADRKTTTLLWPALGTAFGGMAGMVTAFGTCCFLCLDAVQGPRSARQSTPLEGENQLLMYLLFMGLAGALPALLAGSVAAVARRHSKPHGGEPRVGTSDDEAGVSDSCSGETGPTCTPVAKTEHAGPDEPQFVRCSSCQAFVIPDQAGKCPECEKKLEL